MDPGMIAEDLPHRILHVRIQMDRIDELDVIEGLDQVAQGLAHLAERLAEALSAMRGDQQNAFIPQHIAKRSLYNFIAKVSHALKRVDSRIPGYKYILL